MGSWHQPPDEMWAPEASRSGLNPREIFLPSKHMDIMAMLQEQTGDFRDKILHC